MSTAEPDSTRQGLHLAGHRAMFDGQGRLLPWTTWPAALELEMRFYGTCPRDHGYPRFVCETFLDGDWLHSNERDDIIPATQIGMGIQSYLKYFQFQGGEHSGYLDTARAMGDYLIKETLTPNGGAYPAFTRSTGRRNTYPLAADSGTQSDRPFEIQPDKGGIAGYALARLYDATGTSRYLEQSLHNARVLAANQQAGDASHSPWAFRVDYRDGTPRGRVSSNMSFILRLYDALIGKGYVEFAGNRQALWRWITDQQIPSASSGGSLFAQFFEDHDTADNRNAWAPLNLARYLLQQRTALDPDWLLQAGLLVDFVRARFTHQEFGITVCHEQDEDHEAWNGINSTYGAVLALYARAVGSSALADEARQALNFTLYCIDAHGRPRDVFKSGSLGGWQEDAHTDVIHNFMDTLVAFPEWGCYDCGAGFVY